MKHYGWRKIITFSTLLENNTNPQQKKKGNAGDISTWSSVQIPPRPSTAKPESEQLFLVSF